MILLKVQYDAYNRQFKLLDRELARMLEDGETYLLVADFSMPAWRQPILTGIATQTWLTLETSQKEHLWNDAQQSM